MRPEPTTTPAALSRRSFVAPMVDQIDRRCRFFPRQLSRHTLLYTEIVTIGALLHGGYQCFLRYDGRKHLLVLQLGGSVSTELATCARPAEETSYDEVNLNADCPGDRVQRDMIGVCLMRYPVLVAGCIKVVLDAMKIVVTVKRCISISGRDSYTELCNFVGQVREAGCQSFMVRARIAILEGLLSKENREVPPLRYEVTAQLKRDSPGLEIVLNGSIKTLEVCREHLQTLDGVVSGREVCHNPYLLTAVDSQLSGSEMPPLDLSEASLHLRPYIKRHQVEGGTIHHVTRYIPGLAQGFPDSRRFRQLLSVDMHKAADLLQVFNQVLELLAGR